MFVRLDFKTGKPIYRQIMDGVKLVIVSEELSSEEKLPSVRGFAKQLRVNPATVAKAYNLLQQEGFIVLRQGQGAFVASPNNNLTKSEKNLRISQDIRDVCVKGIHLGVSRQELTKLFTKEFDRIKGDRK